MADLTPSDRQKDAEKKGPDPREAPVTVRPVDVYVQHLPANQPPDPPDIVS